MGIPGCVGKIARELRREKRKHFELVGYLPSHLPADAPQSGDYDRIEIVCHDRRFSPGQILQMWEDLYRNGISPGQVQVLGFGGGSITAVEYRIAFALGATVAAVEKTGGASDDILADAVWCTAPSVLALPFDPASIQAFTLPATQGYENGKLLEMARAFHAH